MMRFKWVNENGLWTCLLEGLEVGHIVDIGGVTVGGHAALSPREPITDKSLHATKALIQARVRRWFEIVAPNTHIEDPQDDHPDLFTAKG